MSAVQTILVTAAGGHIGLELTPLLLKGEAKLVFATSNADRLRSTFPGIAESEHAVVEEGSIKHPRWVEAIIKKHAVTSVFFCVTGGDELIVSLNFFDAMARAGGVKHLVWISGCGNFYVEQKAVEQLMKITSCAHMLVKSTLEQKLTFAGFPWATTILGPTLFFTNDLRSKPSMLKDGFFDEPLSEDVGSSRVSTSDIALAARNAMLDQTKWGDKKIQIGSLHQFRASETTAFWAKAIGREVLICDPSSEKDMLAHEDRITSVAPYVSGIGPDGAAAWGRDVMLMYETFAQYGFGMSEEEYKLQVELLGKEPEDYEQWVAAQGKGSEYSWNY